MPVPEEEIKNVVPEEQANGVDPVAQYKHELAEKFDTRYKSIIERLKTESNIIIRYELKVALEELLQVYKLLFKEGQ